MVEKPERRRVGDRPRGGEAVEWEVFVRDDADAPLRHVGSVTASDADAAYEHATKLFGWFARDYWLCPADAVARYATHDLDDEAEPVSVGDGDEERTFEV